MKKLLNNRYAQLVLVLILGISIGAVFYPTKTIREEEHQKYQRELKQVEEKHVKITNDVKDKYNAEIKSMKSTVDETTRTVNVLRQENHQLRAKTDEGTLRIVRPDGTIIEKTYKKTETEQISKITTSIKDEFTRKVKSIESKWMNIHKERISKIKKDFDLKIETKEKEIFELHKKKVVEINKRNFGIAAGFLTNKNYYSGIDYTIFGPVFLDTHVQSDFRGDFAVGGGIGLRF